MKGGEGRAMTEKEFGNMITQYERLVYTICYQFTKDHHTAEDLAQEAFIAAYRHIDSCPPGDEARPWLARIATNKAKDFLKSAYNRRVAAVDDESMPEDKGALFIHPEQPEDITLSRDTTARIQEYILALKEPYHKVAVLYFIQEATVEEIARTLERPPKTVHTQLYRAKQMLQKKIQEGDGLHGIVS